MIISIDAGDRGGGPSVEAALLAALFGLVIALVIAGGRLVAAEAACDQAARAASRIASSQRDAQQAQLPAAESTLASQGLACVQLDVTVDTSQFTQPAGERGVVRADVACAVRWSDLALPGAPGTHNLEATFTSPIDTLRERER